MAKGRLSLTVNSELVEAAKASGLNLSNEFEEWIKIRLGQYEKEKSAIDTGFEIAKHQAEIQRLNSIAEEQKKIDCKDSDVNEFLDKILDSIIETDLKIEHNKGRTIMDMVDALRIHAIEYFFKKKFDQDINGLEARAKIEERIKERGL